MADSNPLMKWILIAREEHQEVVEIPVWFYHILAYQCGGWQIYRGEDGVSWDIVIHKTCIGNMITGMYIDVGWREFISDNDIEVGDTLIMYFMGNGVCHTKIYTSIGEEKTHLNVPTTKTIPIRRRLPLSIREMDAHLSLMQQECPEPSFKYVFSAQCIYRGIIVVPVLFARAHFHDMEPCTGALLRHRMKQWCVELHLAKENNLITDSKLKNGINLFYEEHAIVDGVGALVVYRRGYPILFELMLGPV